MNSEKQSRLIVLFDGDCNLCNNSVNFIRAHDHSKKIKLVPQQSKEGEILLREFRLAEDQTSIVFIEGKQVWLESTAVFMICKYLDGIYKTGILFLLFPPFLRNTLYRVIARNRYKWFGKRRSL